MKYQDPKILNVGKKEWLIAEGSNQEPVRIQLFTSARSQKHIDTYIYSLHGVCLLASKIIGANKKHSKPQLESYNCCLMPHEPLSQFRLCYLPSTPAFVFGHEEASWMRWWLLLIPTKYIYSHLPRVQVENVAANDPYNMGDLETWRPCIESSTVSPALGSPQFFWSDADSPTFREAKWLVGPLKWFASASSYPWCRFSHCMDPWLHDNVPYNINESFRNEGTTKLYFFRYWNL